MNKPNKEIPILDNLRAIAAWSVCLYHFVCTTTGFIDKNSTIYKTFSVGCYGVHLFFIISGLVIPWSLYHSCYRIKNFFKFFIKRLARLEPPYMVSVLMMLSVLLLRKYSPAYDNNEVPVTAKQIILHVGYLIPFFKGMAWLNNVYWTLAIEFQYYILIGLLYFLIVSKQLYVRLFAYLFLASSPVLFPGADFLPYWLPVFGVGILIFLYKSQHISLIEYAVVSLVLILDVFIYNTVTAGFVSLISGLVIVLLFNHSFKLIAWLGKFSYSVYLMHAVAGATIVNVLSHYATGVGGKAAVVATGVAVTFVSSYLMYLFVEKPSKKLSSKLAYRK